MEKKQITNSSLFAPCLPPVTPLQSADDPQPPDRHWDSTREDWLRHAPLPHHVCAWGSLAGHSHGDTHLAQP